MALLVLDRVSKRFARGDAHGRDHDVLCDVSLELDVGEVVAVVGRRRSGRTTLLEVAAGVEAPSEGSVCFDGTDLRQRRVLGAPGGIGFCMTALAELVGDTAIEQVAAPLLDRGHSPLQARARAHELLDRVGAAECAEVAPAALDANQMIRVAVARALSTAPRILIADDPALGVRLSERDDVLSLMQSLAHEDGIAVLMTVDNGVELAGCDRAASLDAGKLRGETTATAAPVIPLHPSRADSG
jgi:predicted ABC-type transport system involved in lysophospholipase L1 biosynthesis ATPase subunit